MKPPSRMLLLASLLMAFAAVGGDVVFETPAMKLALGEDGCAKSLIVKATGEEMFDVSERVPFAAVVQERPFANEIKLAFPNKRTTYESDSLRLDGDELVIGFRRAPYSVRLRVKKGEAYVAFEFVRFEVPADAPYIRLKMDAPPVEDLYLARLPFKRRKNFGEWLNTVWDDSSAAALIATVPETLIDHEARPWGEILTAAANRRIGFKGTGAALIAAPTAEFLDGVKAVEEAWNLPPGVELRRKGPLNAAIYRVFDITPLNVDEHIKWAKKGGFRLMQIYYSAVVKERYWWPSWCYIGNYDYRDEYPRGKADLAAMLAKLKAAGITPGLHILHPHIGLESRYCTPVCDRRLRLKERFTLSASLGADTNSVELAVDENPAIAPMADRCRVLRFGGELMTYEGVSASRPHRFTGVRRGAFGTTVTAHPAGEIGGVMDISEFAGNSCYIDQESDLQDEIADKIADIYSAGFEFVYFDGSEGVNSPYNYWVGAAQYRVWKKLRPTPLFAEGAAKTHFGWHMLSGANAFDAFPPELFKAMIAEHPLKEAPLMRRDFTRVNFGWWHYVLPSAKTVGTQPDMWEYGTSKAAAWDCPATVCIPLIGTLAKHPKADELFETLRRWQDVRDRNLLTPEQKAMLRDPRREFHLEPVNGTYRLIETTPH